MRTESVIRLGAVVIPLVIVACGGEEPPPQPPPPPPVASAQAAPPAIGSAAVAAPPPAPAPAPRPSIADNIKALFDAINAHDANTEGLVYAQNGVMKTIGTPDVSGRAAITQNQADGMVGFPDLKVTRLRQLQKGNVAVFQLLMTGTNTGAFAGQKPSGRAMAIPGLSICTFDDDHLIAEERIYYDIPTLLSQLDPKAKAGTFRAAVPAPTSPTDVHSAAGTPAEDANAAVIAGIAGPLDKFASALSAILPDTATYDLAGSPTVMTGKQYKAVVASIQKRYSDASVAEPNVWAFDDYVVAEWVFSGTNKAKKKAVTTHGAIVIQMAGGKIANAWDYDNRLELEAQLAPTKQP